MKLITGPGGINEEKVKETAKDTKKNVISSPVSVSVPVPVLVIAEAPEEEKGSKSQDYQLLPTTPRSPSSRDMSKLSDAVKALIHAGHAKPGYTRAGLHVQPVLERLAKDAGEKKVGLPAWVTVSVS